MIHTGIDVLLTQQAELVRGRRIGLIASPSSVDSMLTSSVERLIALPDVQLVALYGPEHGVRGSAQAGDYVATYIDPATGVPVYSLYGETQKPLPSMLEGVDALLYDLQDGGVRFFTYLSTLVNVLGAAAEQGIEVIVLDRPNPISGLTPEGGLLDPAYRSFVGIAPVPIRHAMTAGELALYCNDVLGIGCEVTVIKADGWRRSMWFDDTGLPFVPPSPNMPTLTSLTAYPGTCLVEGTNLSEGRGTTRPFEMIGAPWLDGDRLARELNALDLPGARFRPVYYVPMYSKYQGEACSGVQIHILNRQAFRAVSSALHLIARVKASYPDQFAWHGPWAEGSHLPIDLLGGGAQIREHLDAGRPVVDLLAEWQPELAAYDDQRAPYLLYED